MNESSSSSSIARCQLAYELRDTKRHLINYRLFFVLSASHPMPMLTNPHYTVLSQGCRPLRRVMVAEPHHFRRWVTVFYTRRVPRLSRFGLPGMEKKRKEKLTSYIVLKRQKKTLKKKSKEKGPLRLEHFFLRILELFFFLRLGNRFRSADLGGVEPLRKFIRQKLGAGRPLE